MRLCQAKGVKAIFHKWAEVSEIIPPSPMTGGQFRGRDSVCYRYCGVYS